MLKNLIEAASVMAICGAAALAQPAAPVERGRPNVVFILADDLGWRDTAVYGSTFYETPNIDALAASGVRFTNAYAANPLCSPTRASVLTGQYPVRHGLTSASGHIPGKQAHEERTRGPEDVRAAGPSSSNYLDPAHHTLGKAMHDAGYATAFFGKWHLGHAPEYYPENHGFDFVRGGRHHPGPPGKNPARKFFPPWDCDTLDSDVPPDTHVDDYIADEAIKYMKKQQADGKPFFVCYWAYSVHAPFQSKPELVEKWKKKVDPASPQHSPTMGAMIEVFDSNVGRLMSALKESGLDQNTIVILTSDNGGNMYDTVDGTTPTNNAPLRNGKGNNYEGGVRVPLIVRWPGQAEPGRVSEAVVSSVDHYPSILQMTGQALRPDDHKDGVSYAPALEGKPHDRGPTLCDFPHAVVATYNIPNTSLRLGSFKLYRFWHDQADQSHRYELYDVGTDIGETTDLAARQPEQVAKLAKMIDDYYGTTGVLSYHPNDAYNGRTVGTWFATSDAGQLRAEDGALVIESREPGFTVRNRFFPSVGAEGAIVFEARSAAGTRLTIAGEKGSKTVTPEAEWKTFRIPTKDVTTKREGFSVRLESAGRAEVRNACVVTADGTVMMRYEFR